MFIIKREENVKKELNKIKKKNIKTFEIINKKIEELEKKPFPNKSKHILSTNRNQMLCELCFKTIRIYYILTKEEIIIEKIEYEGTIDVFDLEKRHKSGNKQNNPRQRKYINKTKKKFNKR